jgi:hypothetical protein
MIRLRKDDFHDAHELAKLAATAGLSNEEFSNEFEYLVVNDPPAALVEGRIGVQIKRENKNRRSGGQETLLKKIV